MPLPHFIPRHFPSLVIFCPLATVMIMGKVLVMRSLFNLATWMSRKLMLLPKDCNFFFLPLQFESFWSGPLPMHLMKSWALLQVTLLSGGLTILLVLDLDGTTGKTEEAGEKYPLYRWGKICLSRGAAFIIPISFIRSSRSQRPRSIHYGHSQGGEILRRGTTFSSLLGESESFDSVKTSINTTHQKTLHTSFFFPFHLFIPVSNNLTDPLLFELGLPSKD